MKILDEKANGKKYYFGVL